MRKSRAHGYGGARRDRTAISRRDVLKVGAGAAGVALLGGIGYPRPARASERTLTLGNIGWDENVALAYLTKVILEDHLDYEHVELRHMGVGDLFHGVASGQLDGFQDVWLPNTHHTYWRQYGDQVERLGSWYRGDATLGLTVPDYVEAQSIDDLARDARRYNGEIVGIEPSAGEMRIVRDKVMPGYGLDDLKLVASDTPSMLSRLEDALHHARPIVVTLWQPHWAFTVYRIRYLKDPKGLMSSNEGLYSIVRKGLKADKPDAYAFMNAISLTPDQLGKLELAINLASSPADGVRTWLKQDRPFGSQRGLNQDLVQPWIDAARKARSSA